MFNDLDDYDLNEYQKELVRKASSFFREVASGLSERLGAQAANEDYREEVELLEQFLQFSGPAVSED